MMTLAEYLRSRPVGVLSILLLGNGLLVAAMMHRVADTGIIAPLLGGAALLMTLAALIALVRLVSDPLDRLEAAVRSLSAEVAQSGEPVAGTGLPLASSGDITASRRALLRLRQVVAERRSQREEERRHQQDVDALLAAQVLKQTAEEDIRNAALSQLAEGLRRLGRGEAGLSWTAPVPPELEPLRHHFNRVSALVAEHGAVDGSHAAVLRDTGLALSTSTDLAEQAAKQASTLVQLRHMVDSLNVGRVQRGTDTEEIAGLAAQARTAIGQCAANLAATQACVNAAVEASAKMRATAADVQTVLRDAGFATLNAGINAVQAYGDRDALDAALQEVRAIALRSAQAAKALSVIAEPAVTKNSRALAALERTRQEVQSAGERIAALETRSLTLAHAGRADAGIVRRADAVLRELERGAANHVDTVERTVTAMSALSRSLGRLELRSGRSATSKTPLALQPRPSRQRPYLRCVK